MRGPRLLSIGDPTRHLTRRIGSRSFLVAAPNAHLFPSRTRATRQAEGCQFTTLQLESPRSDNDLTRRREARSHRASNATSDLQLTNRLTRRAFCSFPVSLLETKGSH